MFDYGVSSILRVYMSLDEDDYGRKFSHSKNLAIVLLGTFLSLWWLELELVHTSIALQLWHSLDIIYWERFMHK